MPVYSVMAYSYPFIGELLTNQGTVVCRENDITRCVVGAARTLAFFIFIFICIFSIVTAVFVTAVVFVNKLVRQTSAAKSCVVGWKASAWQHNIAQHRAPNERTVFIATARASPFVMPVANEGLLTVVALATIGRVMCLPMRTKLPIHFRILVPQESVKCVR